MVVQASFELRTEGNASVVDITSAVADEVSRTGLDAGIATIFTPSSTTSLTTIEYEPGCVSDLQRLFDEIINPNRPYEHNQRWGDGNGHSHVRAALLGPSLTVPFSAGHLTLGTWQQIILVDFDNRARTRRLVVQVIGE